MQFFHLHELLLYGLWSHLSNLGHTTLRTYKHTFMKLYVIFLNMFFNLAEVVSSLPSLAYIMELMCQNYTRIF